MTDEKDDNANAERVNVLVRKKPKKDDFNHAEYARMVNKQLRNKKTAWQKELEIKKDGKKAPIVNGNEEVRKAREEEKPKKRKLRIKPE